MSNGRRKQRELISQQAAALLNLRRLPARLDVEQTATILGHSVSDIPILIRGRLLEPLGNPLPNAPKWFSAADIVDRAEDPDWLNKASDCVSKHWKRKNGSRSKAPLPSTTPMVPA